MPGEVFGMSSGYRASTVLHVCYFAALLMPEECTTYAVSDAIVTIACVGHLTCVFLFGHPQVTTVDNSHSLVQGTD